ncbi:rRNA adenine N(6)-methyltransferase family protein [Paenibacillus motobuensis]|uniref:23S ribosomal RNA methyltransferase Erm n=1 Tax=Paenibacillus TaxID=44249 RepID=UPI002041C642|nr:rRNA adenine N(6)-methyltransferase family protein [Paenibacillus lutimineralis]MCM3649245.1 rRNA adenine N(6)-methyltransferase family protein [Paenibacillus motobuensis]
MSKNNNNHRKKWKKESNFSAQHLLISKRLIHDMIALARIRPTDTVLDIGAGTGALTYPLAEKAAHVLAIETDSAFIDRLFSKMQDRSNIRIKQSDFLEVSLPRSPFTVVANIPYAITTPILGKLLDHPGVPLQRAVLLVEKGAAKRFTAAPIIDPRILSWRMQYEIRLVRTVSPHHFAPAPQMDSAILLIQRREEPFVLTQHQPKFTSLAAYGLRDPRLPLFAALSGVFTPPQIARLVRMLKVNREYPIGRLNEEQWGTVFHTMLQHVPPHRWPQWGKSSKGKSKRRK